MNKIAIVTGASQGIGRGIALKLAKEGYDIAFSFFSATQRAEELCAEIQSTTAQRCAMYCVDMRKDGAGAKFVNQVSEEMGVPCVLVNNAGRTRMESILDITPETVDELINLDLKNYLFCMQAAATQMVRAKISGSIINITSTRAERAYPCDAVYGGVKAALNPTTTFSEACNIGDGYYKDENGQFQWAPADTRTLDALKKYQDLYQEGILDSEFYSYTRYQGAQKFYVQGTSGLTLEDGHAIMITYIRNGLAEQGLDPDKVLHLAQLVGDDGMYHYREDSNYWGQVMFSPTISQEKFERAMDILDYTCTEEGQNFMNMGFEGIDWKLDENGNYVSLLDPSIQGSATSVLGGKYPSKESSFGGLILPDDFSLVSPNYSHEIQDTVRGFYKLREELSDTTTLLPREYEYEFLSSREKSQATMDLGDEYAKLVLKDGELEDNWNTWVEEKMAVVQPVLDQLNK